VVYSLGIVDRRPLDLAEVAPSGDRNQDKEINSANEANGSIETTLDIDSTSMFPFNLPKLSDFQEGPRIPELGINFRTEDITPPFGLMFDEPPTHQLVDGGPSSLHAAAPGTHYWPPFKGDAVYPFCLSPNARQVSGTIQGPWRIMELPSNEVAHDQLDTSSGQYPSPEEIDCKCLREEPSSTRCDCY